MNFDQFQSGAAKTAAELSPAALASAGSIPGLLAALRAAMGMSGEANEVIEHLKKVLFQGHDYDKSIVYSETADVLWYIAVLCEDMGWRLEDMAYYVLAKLRARYPEEHFCAACSRTRNEGFETQALPCPPSPAADEPYLGLYGDCGTGKGGCGEGELSHRFAEAILVASPSTPEAFVQGVQKFLGDLPCECKPEVRPKCETRDPDPEKLAKDYLGPCKCEQLLEGDRECLTP